MLKIRKAAGVLCAGMIALGSTLSGCSTAPKEGEKASVISDSLSALAYFERNVDGLSQQLEDSGGYISFPGVGQYGIIIGGGKFGRGVVYNGDGERIGWAYVNVASAGLQLGAKGFKMLVVFEDESVLREFQVNKLSGNASATVVVGDRGSSGVAPFVKGVTVYQGDASGLMAGVSIGLEYIRYEAR